MKKYSYLLLSTLMLFLSFPVITKASHYAAADISIRYVGAGVDGCTGTAEYKYEVKLYIYKACEPGSIQLGTTERLYWNSASVGWTQDSSRTLTAVSKDTLDELCPQFKDSNTCRTPGQAGPYFAFIRHTYLATIILPSAQPDWRFWWSSGGRNSAIQNIATTSGGSSPSGNIYIEAGINNVVKYNNSSPEFQSSPLPYLCAGQPAIFLNSPYDVNGDSLDTYVHTPLNNGPNALYFWRSGYSLADPIGSDPNNPFTLNRQTGTVTFTPVNQGKFVIAFRCDEYERGSNGQTRLAYIMRDVQLSIFPCNAPPPAVDSLPISMTAADTVNIEGKTGIIACPGSNIQFTVTSKSTNSTSNLYMSANTANIAGSSFTTVGDGTSSISGTFSWTPTTAQIGEHTLIITGKDSTCTGSGFALVLRNYSVILIKVVEGLDAGPDLPICELNPEPVQLFVKGADYVKVNWTKQGGAPATSLSSTTIKNPTAKPLVTTAYVVSSPNLKGACKSRDTVVVYHDKTNGILITPRNPVDSDKALVLCRPGYVQLEAHPIGRPPLNNVSCGVSSPTNCPTPDERTVYGTPAYGAIAYDTVGDATPIMYNTLRTTKMQFLVRKEDLWEAGIRAATIRAISLETQGTSTPSYEYHDFRIMIKCTNKKELNKDDGFETVGMTQVYNAPSVTFEDGVHEYSLNVPYNWDTTKNLIVQLCFGNNPTVDTGCGVTSSPPLVKFAPTSYISGMILKAPNQATLSVCGVDKDPDIKAMYTRPVMTFKYCEANPKPFKITWNDGEYLSDSTIAQPLAYVPKSAQYIVQTIGRSGCIMKDTLDIYVPNHDFKLTPKDTSICYGEGAPISIYNGSMFKWYEYANAQYVESDIFSCKDCAQPVVKPLKSTTYRVVVSDSVYCYDTLEGHIEIMPLPDVRILNADGKLKYGQSMELLATGARTYNWSPVSAVSNPYSSHPMATPKENTRFILGGIGANGCRAFDTLYVTMDYRDNIFVPSAFSPNGDGKNDMFRLSNLTFQRVMEFRVFNRWGQEIFSTTDSDRGWDGMWKGEPQPVGNYTYLIRVGYPDGFVETYKGDVTLVR